MPRAAIGDEALAGEVDVGNRVIDVGLPPVDRQRGAFAHLQAAGLVGEGLGGRERCGEIGVEHLASVPHPGASSHCPTCG
jgi:hypothetical protein